MKTFFNEHPVVGIVIGAVTAFIGNYVGGMIMGRGFGQLVVNEADKVCDENEVHRIE